MKELIQNISNSLEKLEQGNLSATALHPLVEDSRELYERLVVLRYKALEKSVQKMPAAEEKPEEEIKPFVREEQLVKPFKLNLATEKKEEKPSQHSAQSSIFMSEETQHEQTYTQEEIEENHDQEEKKELSLNEKLAQSQQKMSLAEKLQKKPIADLRSSIGLNQKFLFMNDLFEGENTAYNSAVDQLNNFSSMDDAKNFLLSLGTKYSWDLDSESVIQFTELVERRYA